MKQKKGQEDQIHSLGQMQPWNLSNAALTIMHILVELRHSLKHDFCHDA